MNNLFIHVRVQWYERNSVNENNSDEIFIFYT